MTLGQRWASAHMEFHFAGERAEAKQVPYKASVTASEELELRNIAPSGSDVEPTAKTSPAIHFQKEKKEMTSHEYARKLQVAAEFLLSKPEFETPNRPLLFASFWSRKEQFLAAVKALGSGEKKWTDSELKFVVPIAEGVTFDLDIQRSVVCRKVQEAKWECDPLLSPEEEAQIPA